jgi:hypothetical protein
MRFNFTKAGSLNLIMSTVLLLGGIGTASAFTTSDRTNCWNNWNANFYYMPSTSQAYYISIQGANAPASFWQSAEEIEIAEDAQDTNRVILLCAGFIQNNGTDWSGNTFNDDLEWASIAFSRAYRMTGNNTYLTLAENGFNVAYNRGWDTTYGGGIWQNTADANGPGKLSCANGPGCIAAFLIYQNTGNTSYLAKAQAINSWQKANNYDPATGKVYESNTSTNTCYSYDSGTFAGSCWYLGDTNTAMQCGDWVKTNWGIPMQHFGTGADAGGFNGICLRWLGKVGYDPGFLRAVCDNALALQNSVGLVSDGWYGAPTSNTNALYGWDCGSIVAAVFSVTPTQPGLVSGQVYQLEPQNAPGKRLDVRNAGTTDGTQVQIFTTNNTVSQKWMLIAVDATNNIYSLQPQNALGECLGIQGGLSVSGTPVQIFTASNTLSQKWKFIVIDPTNGIYSLQPQNAIGMCLDVQGGLSADSTPVQIFTSNNTVAQKWRLYPFPAPASPTFQGLVPGGGSVDVPVATPISMQVVVGGLPVTNILLKVDGGTVISGTSTNSGIITVNYQPSPALSAGSLHTAQIIVNDSSGSAFTNAWSFTTAFQSLPAILRGPIVVSNNESGLVIFSTNDAWVGANYGPASGKTIYARFNMEFDNLNGKTGSSSGGGYGGLHFFIGGANGTPHLIAGDAWVSTNWSVDPYPPLPQTDLNPITPIVFHQWHTIVERVDYTPGGNSAVKIWLDPNFSLTEAAQLNVPITFSMDDTFDTIMLRTGNGTTSATFSNIVIAATSGDTGFAVTTAVMSVTQSGGSMNLSWTSTGTLQQAPAVTGPWMDATNQAKPQVLNMTNPTTFYRLRQ